MNDIGLEGLIAKLLKYSKKFKFTKLLITYPYFFINCISVIIFEKLTNSNIQKLNEVFRVLRKSKLYNVDRIVQVVKKYSYRGTKTINNKKQLFTLCLVLCMVNKMQKSV